MVSVLVPTKKDETSRCRGEHCSPVEYKRCCRILLGRVTVDERDAGEQCSPLRGWMGIVYQMMLIDIVNQK